MSRRKVQNLSVREQLELFVFRVEELRNTGLLKNQGLKHSLTISYDDTVGISFKQETIDNDLLRSYALTYRQFVSDSEPIHLFKIYNICFRHVTNDKIKNDLQLSRERWKQELKNGGFKFTYNDKEYTPEDIADLWINGYYFHNDKDKLDLLLQLLPHEDMLVRHIFIDNVIETTKIIFSVDYLLRIVLEADWLTTA